MNKEEVIQYLEGKGIPFDVMDHPAVYTIEDMEKLHIKERFARTSSCVTPKENGIFS